MVNLLSAPTSGGSGTASAAPGHLTQDLALSGKAVHHARRIVVESVCMWGYDHVAFDVGIVVTELLANVLQHAVLPRCGGAKRARLVVQVLRALPAAGRLIVVVHDDDPTMPKERLAGQNDLNGRGLGLIRSLTDELSFVPIEGGKDAVAVISLETSNGEAAA
ncbi:ATP-binding protein [Streptomyces sp. NPDC059835]|uniref:ATP-binding protein n=1 Tax=Streptomyces sp. NPDC059835 TaxID=3346967 RepID=UPI00365B13BF